MKNRAKMRVIALLLSIIMTTVSLMSCQSERDNTQVLPSANENNLTEEQPRREKTAPENVFKVVYPDTDIESNTWLQYAVNVGDEAYLVASFYRELSPADSAEQQSDTEKNIDRTSVGETSETNEADTEREEESTEKFEKDAEHVHENGISLIKVSSGGKVATVRDFTNSYTYDAETKISGFVNYSAAMPSPDGGITVLAQIGSENRSQSENPVYKSENRLIKYGADGSELLSINVTETMQPLVDNGVPRTDINFNRFFFNSDGNIILCGDRVIAVIDEKGALIAGKGTAGNVRLGNFVQRSNGEILCVSYTYDSEALRDVRKIVKIDTLTADITVIGDMPFDQAYSIYPCGGSDKVLVSNRSALYIYDVEKGALNEYVNWLNSDLNSNRITVLTSLSDGRVVISENAKDYTDMRIAILSRNTRPEKKYNVTLASVYLDDGMTEAIIGFNKKSEDKRILYKDYSIFNSDADPELGVKTLVEDMRSENSLDIVSLTGLSLDELVIEESIAELSELISSDEEFSIGDYYENVLYSYDDTGSVYSIIPTFTVETVTGKTEIFGESPLSVKRLFEISAQYPQSSLFGNVTRDELLTAFIRLSAKNFATVSEGKSYFDSEQFASLLKLIRSYPSEIDWNGFYEGMTEEEYRRHELSYYENRTLLSCSYISKFAITEREKRFGDRICFTGFPGVSDGKSAIKPQTELAICAGSENTDLAWEFLKYLISKDGAVLLSSGFSLNRAVTEKMASDAVDSIENDENTVPGENQYIERELTTGDISEILMLLENADGAIRENTDLERTVKAWANKFFNYEISAEDAAKGINDELALLSQSVG